MPSKERHLEQARHNRTFFKAIDLDAFPDWAMTALFYTAIHYVDAVLAVESNTHPDRHDSRDSEVAKSPVLNGIYDEYRKLKTDSFNARYNPPFKRDRVYIGVAETLYLGRILNVCSPVVDA